MTQRLDEIRGFADAVTLLGRGRVCFTGSVPELMAHARPRSFLLHLAPGTVNALAGHEERLRGTARLTIASDDAEHALLELVGEASLGSAIGLLAAHGVDIVSCREEQSEIEEAFLALTRGVPE